MLKIKDNICLEELEKFNFRLKHNNIIRTTYYVRPKDENLYEKFTDKNLKQEEQNNMLLGNDVVAVISSKSNPYLYKRVYIIKKQNNCDLEYPFSEVSENDINDLIKADMVEKVVEDE